MRSDSTWARGTNRLRTLLAIIPIVVIGMMGVSASAFGATPAPAWSVASTPMPTNFAPGDSSDHVSLLVRNSGAAATDGSTVTVTDTLPAGLTATGISGTEHFTFGSMECTVTPITCTYSSAVPSGDVFTIDITVSVASNAPSGATNSATVSGGGATGASESSPVTVSSSSAPFGIGSGGFSVNFTGPDGTSELQAGAHPDATVGIQFNTVPTSDNDFTTPVTPSEFEKDTQVALPPGVLGNPQAVSQCPRASFNNSSCPTDSQIGIGLIQVGPVNASLEPIYNIAPQAGDTADFGFGPVFNAVSVHIIASVRSNGDYGVTETSNNIGEAVKITGLTLTFWGVPADPSHDAARFAPHGLFPGNNGNPIPDTSPPAPFLMNPTQCGEPLSTTIGADSWANPGRFIAASSTTPSGITGCDALSFEPSLSVRPDATQAGSPSGYSIELKVPQALAPNQLATPTLQNATVTLPRGVVVSPGQADGLGACPFANDGVGTTGPPSCDSVAPNSKIGSVEITTPLLPDRLEGSVYLLQSNPPNLKILLAASADGVNLKLVGDVHLDPSTGQITSTFDNNPQLPFSDLVLHLNDGPRASLANPRTCGTFTTTSDLMPDSAPASGPDAAPSSSFDASGCGDPNRFAPAFTAGTANPRGGAYSPFVLSFSRTDADQELSGLSVTLPRGLLAAIRGVPLCSDADANSGNCPASSQIGTVQTGSGAGPDPLFLPGKIYLTGPYNGGPFGESVVVPAVAGPFNLGDVVVRGSIRIDPTTAQAAVVSDPFPTMLDGVPLQLRRVDVTLDRPNFTFNPTSCEPTAITGALTSTGGLTSPVSMPFQVTNCATLKFKPVFKVSTSGKTSRANGASLHVKLSYPNAPFGTQANIKSVHVELPKALPSRLSTLNHACLDSVFNQDPASCPSQSKVGVAKAVTPVLPVPLEGPAYFVSHGGQRFPELIVVLQGYGVTVYLQGETFISKAGITSSTFKSVPDVPVGSFELTLPEGAFSALAANTDLCAANLAMPTTFTGQNGAVLKQRTSIEVQGCPYALRIVHRAVKKRTLTLKVSVPQGGKLVATGKGLTRAAKSIKGRYTLTLKLKERHAGKLRTKVLLRFTPGKGKQRKVLRKSITVSFR